MSKLFSKLSLNSPFIILVLLVGLLVLVQMFALAEVILFENESALSGLRNESHVLQFFESTKKHYFQLILREAYLTAILRCFLVRDLAHLLIKRSLLNLLLVFMLFVYHLKSFE